MQRAYGELKTTGDDAQSVEQVNDKAMTGHDRAEILTLKGNQIVGIPKLVIAWRSRKNRALEKQIETLTREIETIKQHRIVNP